MTTSDPDPLSPEALRHDLDEQAEKQRRLGKEVDRYVMGIGAVIVILVMCLVIGQQYDESHPPTATTRDDNVESLLASGAHCYNSFEEMAAARQRALAAIDRLQWLQEHPDQSVDPDPEGTMGVGTGSSALQTTVPGTVSGSSLPKVVGAEDPGVTAPIGETVDTNVCFGIIRGPDKSR